MSRIMNLRYRGARLGPILTFTVGLACAPGESESGSTEPRERIAATLERYMVAARTVNPDSIAAFYAADAVLFEPGINPIQTRDSIRAFMGSFPGVRVDS